MRGAKLARRKFFRVMSKRGDISEMNRESLKQALLRQEDEISVLESIFNDDEILRSKEQGPITGQLCAFIDKPLDLVVVMMTPDDYMGPSAMPTLTYLPPITLHYSLPDDYPELSAPKFTLTCHWLTREQLSRLCRQLDRMWEENLVDSQGMEILYDWIHFLKMETLSFLKISVLVDVTPIERMYNLKRGPRGLNLAANEVESSVVKTPGERAAFHIPTLNLKKRVKDFMELDKRAVLDVSAHDSLANYLLHYDAKKLTAKFVKQSHMCNICSLSIPGSNCTEFLPCHHVFCKDCSQMYFSEKITSRKVVNIACPEYECNSHATFHQVKSLISAELFDKYDSFLLDATLNSLGDIVICPRSFCQYRVTRDKDEKLAICSYCSYAFCVECRRGYHAVEPCRFKNGEEQQIVKEYSQGTSEDRAALEKRYSKKRLEQLVNTSLTNTWITDNSKNCPQCNVPIQKSSGCNKITCGKCETNFCWMCSAKLDANFPYTHFTQLGSKCYDLLFQGVGELNLHEVMNEEEYLQLVMEDEEVRLRLVQNNPVEEEERQDGLIENVPDN